MGRGGANAPRAPPLVTGLSVGMAVSTVASEKNREMLFIGNVFYKH